MPNKLAIYKSDPFALFLRIIKRHLKIRSSDEKVHR